MPGGKPAIKGITAQIIGALSLFLQHMRREDFAYVHLEEEGFKDFTIVFSDQRRIVCESKDWGTNFSYAQLRSELVSLKNKDSINQNDKILFVVTNLDTELVAKVREAAFNPEVALFLIEQKNFTKEIIPLLQYVDFWEVKTDFNEQVLYALTAELFDFSFPRIKEFVHSILFDKFLKGSSAGTMYQRSDILSAIQEQKDKQIQSSAFFNPKNNSIEEKLSFIDQNFRKIPKDIDMVSTITADPLLISYCLSKISERTDLDLQDFELLFEARFNFWLSNQIFRIFKNNLTSKNNQSFVISYLSKHSKEFFNYFQDDSLVHEINSLLPSVINNLDEQHKEDVFNIIKSLLDPNKYKRFYEAPNPHSQHFYEEDELISKSLAPLYHLSSPDKKDQIVQYILDNFNLIKDDHNFLYESPQSVFRLIYEWLNSDFQKRFPIIKSVLTKQFKEYFWATSKGHTFYDGWEHIGGGLSYSGNYSINERVFIKIILKPAFWNFYIQNKSEYWTYIKEHCIHLTEEVSIDHPDYLNRSVIDIVLDQYFSGTEIEAEYAYTVLKDFITSLKGIPNKGTIIFYKIQNSQYREKVWQLVQLTFSLYPLPFDPFVEEIVFDFASSGNKEAVAKLEEWFSHKDFFTRFTIHHNAPKKVLELLKHGQLSLGVKLIIALLENESFNLPTADSFIAYDTATTLHIILLQNYKEGLKIIRKLESLEILSKNQQIVYSLVLHPRIEKGFEVLKSKENELALKLYNDVIAPFLKKYSDTGALINRLPLKGARSNIAQFAEHLASTNTHENIGKALQIICRFIEDPDPYPLGDDPEDPNGEYNTDNRIKAGENTHSIHSVRVWCAWAMLKASDLNGRMYLPTILQLTEKLLKDHSLHVFSFACSVLEHLAQIRLTHVPGDPDTLFVDTTNNLSEALGFAKKVENLAFQALDRVLQMSEFPKAQEALSQPVLRVFHYLRALPPKSVVVLFDKIAQLPYSSIRYSADLLMYFAEHRQEHYKNWKFQLDGLYDDLVPFDNAVFQKKVVAYIESVPEENIEDLFRFISVAYSYLEDAEKTRTIEEKEQLQNLALKYFKLVSARYSSHNYDLIYRAISEVLTNKFDQDWYNLLLACLHTEQNFLETTIENRSSFKYWFQDQDIYSIVKHFIKNNRLKEAIEMLSIITSFPNDILLNEDNETIRLLQEAKETDILHKFYKRSPLRYWQQDDYPKV